MFATSFKRTRDGGGIKRLLVSLSANGTTDTEQLLEYTFDDSGTWNHYAMVYTAAAWDSGFTGEWKRGGSDLGFLTSISIRRFL